MKSRGKYHLASLLIIIGLVPLVALLAALQYKWLGQISESEREKKRITLQKDAQRFGEDFDQEITRAYLYFQSNGDDFNRNNLGNFSEYYDRWANQTPHPQLVSNIWLVTMEAKKAVVSLRLLENTGPVAFSEALPRAVVGSKMARTVLRLRDEKGAGPVHTRGSPGRYSLPAAAMSVPASTSTQMSIEALSASTPCKLFIFPISIEKPDDLKRLTGLPNWKDYDNVLKLSEKTARRPILFNTACSRRLTKTPCH